MKRVTAGRNYRYEPVLMDQFDPRTTPPLEPGEIVTVVNLYGCPPANTMGHCHVNRLDGSFAGLVHCNSLEPVRATREKVDP